MGKNPKYIQSIEVIPANKGMIENETDLAINKLKEEVRVLYNSLLSFKGNSDFHAYGLE